MDQMSVPVGTILGATLLAVVSSSLTYWFTRRMQLEAEWRKDKLNYYSQLIESITAIMSSPRDDEFDRVYTKYAHDHNVVSLVAPPAIVTIAFDFYYSIEISTKKDEVTEEYFAQFTLEQKERLKQLLLAMRKDLGIRPKDKPDEFPHMLRSPLYVE
jgi:hypothetical protein